MPFSITAAVTFTALGCKTSGNQRESPRLRSGGKHCCNFGKERATLEETARFVILGGSRFSSKASVTCSSARHPLFPSAVSSQCIFVSRRCGLQRSPTGHYTSQPRHLVMPANLLVGVCLASKLVHGFVRVGRVLALGSAFASTPRRVPQTPFRLLLSKTAATGLSNSRW